MYAAFRHMEEQTHRATQVADGQKGQKDPALTTLNVESVALKDTIAALRLQQQTETDNAPNFVLVCDIYLYH